MTWAGGDLRDRLRDLRPLWLDGATGTELERRGMAAPLPLWTADAARRDPALLQAVHRDYLQAGSEILTANTFRTLPYTLRKCGLEAEAAAWTRESVAVARAACREAGRGWVAGSMAPLEDCYRPDLVPDAATLEREHARHAGNLAASDANLILVETMGTARESWAAVRAALSTGLPVFVSWILHGEQPGRLYSGEPFADAYHAVAGLDHGGHAVAAFLVNCAPAALVSPAFEAFTAAGETRPWGAYPNAIRPPQAGSAAPGDALSPVEFAAWARETVEAGARIVGGCCGTGPGHIRAATS